MLKVNAGLTRKIGLPAYGSAGASCMIEMEFDQTLVLQDVAAFHNRLTAIYNICREAVDRELIAYQGASQAELTIENERTSKIQEKLENNPPLHVQDELSPPVNSTQ